MRDRKWITNNSSAGAGDVKAFVDLTRQFQHIAFGAALALANNFRQVEDV